MGKNVEQGSSRSTFGEKRIVILALFWRDSTVFFLFAIHKTRAHLLVLSMCILLKYPHSMSFPQHYFLQPNTKIPIPLHFHILPNKNIGIVMPCPSDSFPLHQIKHNITYNGTLVKYFRCWRFSQRMTAEMSWLNFSWNISIIGRRWISSLNLGNKSSILLRLSFINREKVTKKFQTMFSVTYLP